MSLKALPTLLAALFVLAACTRTEEVAQPESDGYCVEVSGSSSVVPADSAIAYFRKHAGVNLTGTNVVHVAKCADHWNVLVEATTASHPLPRIWHVELALGSLQPSRLIRPE